MTSLRHKGATSDRRPGPAADGSVDTDRALLDAARAAILAVGWKRTTLTDVARRAGVSRMTIYRRWPDMQTLLADLMTREWSAVVADSATGGAGDVEALDRIADRIAATVAGLRDNELFRKILEVDPELLLPYLLDRRGRTQDTMLDLLEAAIVDGQTAGHLRPGDPRQLASSLMLASYGFALSAQTMTDRPTALDDELRSLVRGYLAP